MTVAAPINRKAIEDALFTWVNGATGLDVRWAKQKAPEKAAPYATLHVLTQTSIGQDAQTTRARAEDEEPAEGEEVELAARGLRRLVVSVNVYATANDADEDARSHMDKARVALELESFLEPLRTAGLSVIEVGAIISLDELVQGAWRSRCQMDVTFGIASNAVEYVGYFTEVEVEAESIGITPPIIITIEETP